jgi:ubiquinone biosynthesis monooxygenase Coq6
VEAGDLSKIQDWSPPDRTFSNRVSSLTNASLTFLDGEIPSAARCDNVLTGVGTDIGAWKHVDAERTARVQNMQVWDGVSDARISFDASELPSSEQFMGSQQMARLTENLNLQRGLLRHLAATQGPAIYDKVKVDSIVREDTDGGGWPLVQLSDGRILRSRLLVRYTLCALSEPLTAIRLGRCGWFQLPGSLLCAYTIVRVVV